MYRRRTSSGLRRKSAKIASVSNTRLRLFTSETKRDTHLAKVFFTPNFSCKIENTVPYEVPAASIISHTLIRRSWILWIYTRSVRKVSGLALHLRAIVFERPLRGMNVNSKASRTYRLLADICQTYSSCATCLCLKGYFWVRRILWFLKMTENEDQRICIKFCLQLGKTSSETIQMMQKAFGYECILRGYLTKWKWASAPSSYDSKNEW